MRWSLESPDITYTKLMALNQEYQATIDIADDVTAAPLAAAIAGALSGASCIITNGGRAMKVRVVLSPQRYADVQYRIRQLMVELDCTLMCFFNREESVLCDNGVRVYT